MAIELEFLMGNHLIYLLQGQWSPTPTVLTRLTNDQVADCLNQLSMTLLACTRIEARGPTPKIVRQHSTLRLNRLKLMVLQITEADICCG